jgi:hypothetical protein
MQGFIRKLVAGSLACGLAVSAGFAADAKRPVGKGSNYSARLASVTPVAGYEEASFGGSLVFVAANASLGAGEIVAAVTNTSDIVLTLTAQGATSAANLVRANAGARLAVYEGSRIVAAPVIEPGMLKGTSLTASTSPIASSGPAINVVAQQATATPGALVSFDVYLTHAADLRGYQVALTVESGRSGQLTLVDIHQDTAREDFVFGSQQIVNAVDLNGHRMVAALFNGSTDVTAPKYLGTFTYQASADASGTFRVKASVSEETALRDSAGLPIGYQMGTVGAIQIGASR